MGCRHKMTPSVGADVDAGTGSSRGGCFLERIGDVGDGRSCLGDTFQRWRDRSARHLLVAATIPTQVGKVARTDTGNAAGFRSYSQVSESWDRLIAGETTQSPLNLVVVKSAGNDGNDVDPAVAVAVADCMATYAPAEGDCIGDFAGAKDVITVGALELTSAVVVPEAIAMADFSSFGPTDDGRIKPDVVADGVDVMSTSFDATTTADTEDEKIGTSMAAPVVIRHMT